MSEPNDSTIALHEDAPDGLTILPKSEWTEYDQLIWDQFDELIDGMLNSSSLINLFECEEVGVLHENS